VGLAPTGKRRLARRTPISDIQPLIGPISQCAAAVAGLLVLWKFGVVSLQGRDTGFTSQVSRPTVRRYSSNQIGFCGGLGGATLRRLACTTSLFWGTIMDGTGKAAFSGDVAIAEGPDHRDAGSRDLLVANRCHGLMVTPGGSTCTRTTMSGDVGSAASPSCWHGVTTVVFGNCGVGFRTGEKSIIASLKWI